MHRKFSDRSKGGASETKILVLTWYRNKIYYVLQCRQGGNFYFLMIEHHLILCNFF